MQPGGNRFNEAFKANIGIKERRIRRTPIMNLFGNDSVRNDSVSRHLICYINIRIVSKMIEKFLILNMLFEKIY